MESLKNLSKSQNLLKVLVIYSIKDPLIKPLKTSCINAESLNEINKGEKSVGKF